LGIQRAAVQERCLMHRRVEADWYAGVSPENIEFGPDTYLDTSFCLVSFSSELEPGMRVGRASGLYDRATVISGPRAYIDIGEFACLNGTYIVCNRGVTIGSHALLSWGCIITDTSPDERVSIEKRRQILKSASSDPKRILQPVSVPRPVVLEENVWAGFDSVILPGVRVGRGSIIGCKTVVSEDVPPYSVVAGNPMRLLRTLDADDTDERRAEILSTCLREVSA
jgi:acetyltransferase-like isoleucine patch superfamily enzyme